MENKSWVFMVIGAIMLCSCGPNFYLRKAEKALKKAEQLGATVSYDTVTVRIPYAVPETILKQVHVAMPGDTVRIEKERLQIKYVRLKGDSVFIEGKCKGDTIYKDVPVTIVKTIKAKQGFSLWQLTILAIVALLCGYGVRAFMRR